MRTFYIIALILWILGSSYFTKNYFCPADKAKKPAAAAAGAVGAAATDDDCDRSLVFEDGDFSASMSSNLIFQENKSQIKYSKSAKDEYKRVFTETAKYLNENPDRVLVLEGIYFEFEKFKSDEGDLGKLRALALKQILVEEYNIDENQLQTAGRPIIDKECYYDSKGKIITRGIATIFGEKI